MSDEEGGQSDSSQLSVASSSSKKRASIKGDVRIISEKQIMADVVKLGLPPPRSKKETVAQVSQITEAVMVLSPEELWERISLSQQIVEDVARSSKNL